MSENTNRPLITSGAAAFFLSLVIAVVSLRSAVLGPEIDVLRPEQVLVFRIGEGRSSALAVALRIPQINRSSGYNDVLIDAELGFVGDDARFKNNNERIIPLFVERDDSRSACIPGTRCIARRRLAISQPADEMIEVPAGSANAYYYAFVLLCETPEDSCRRFGNAATTLQTLNNHPLVLITRLRFNLDGARALWCVTDPIAGDYVRRNGWQTLPCVRSGVTGSSAWSAL